jgi:hypothetical protein
MMTKAKEAKAKAKAKETRSLSQVSIEDANRKKKLMAFAEVPG